MIEINQEKKEVLNAFVNSLIERLEIKSVLVLDHSEFKMFDGVTCEKKQVFSYSEGVPESGKWDLIVADLPINRKSELNGKSTSYIAKTISNSVELLNEKGHIFQIEAVKRLRDRGKLGNLHFVWAGEGNLTPQLKEIVHKERLDDRFHFLGYRWDIEDWLSVADIFVLSSQLEAFPLCIIEAMAKGLPVVASAVAGVPEEMGNTGALLPDPNKDPQGTAAKLIEVLGQWTGSADIRKQVGALAKKRANVRRQLFLLVRAVDLVVFADLLVQAC